MTRDELHAAVAAGLAERLRADPGVSHLVADRVYAGDDAPASPALPCLVLTPQTDHGSPAPGQPVYQQMDVAAECRAGSQAVLHLLAVAVQRAVAAGGKPAGPLQTAVLSDTGPERKAGQTHTRTDVFACFARPAVGGPFPAPLARAGEGDPEKEAMRARIAELERQVAAADPEPEPAAE